MKSTNNCLNRRGFIYNFAGLVISSAVLPNNIFANNFQQNLNISSAGIDSVRINRIKNAISIGGLPLTFGSLSQKSDLFFVSKASISAIETQIKGHSLIIIDGDFTSISFYELINYCNKKSIHLAKIEKWSDEINSDVLFEKITFIETKVNQKSVNQSINYLNILSKLTTGNGLIIA